MGVFRTGYSYRLSFQGGEQYVIVGLVPAIRGSTTSPRLVSLGAHAHGHATGPDPGRVLDMVLTALRDHEKETGLIVPLKEVEYVPNDSPYYEKYYSLARRLLGHFAPDQAGLDTVQRDAATERLGDAMRDLQERAFGAQWMCVTPTIVGLCRRAIRTGMPQGWGNTDLTVSQANEMWQLAESLGGWSEPDWDGDGDRYIIGHPFSPLESDGLEGEQINWK